MNGASTPNLVISGYVECGFYQKALQHAANLQKKYPGCLNYKANDIPKAEYKEWVSSEADKHAVKHHTSPFVTNNGTFLGGCDDTLRFLKEFETNYRATSTRYIDSEEPEEDHGYDYDAIVVGGGSGGMATSKAIATFLSPEGQASGDPRVVCLDYVKPSPHGTTWGFGGTCVNVGCIPKKLFHTAALTREWAKCAGAFGGPTDAPPPLDWETLKNNVQMHIKKLNFGSVSELRQGNVKYKNALGRLVDAHRVECTNKKGEKEIISARRIVLAMGGRPNYPDIPGAKEYGITSDDIFSLSKPPGKTLVVGASYIALECAGFLTGMGYDATVLMRSIPLRGFDQQMAELVCKYMEEEGTHFIRGATPTKVEKRESDGKLLVGLSNGETFECDTVLFAVGRVPDSSIGLENAGVRLAKSGKILVDEYERTSVPHIYAIGDIIEGGLELTPVAIQAGKLLASRLYGKGRQLMDYKYVATTVFTPLEYGVCGYSEEDAMKLFGEENIEVYHSYFVPLEWTVPKRPADACYIKMIVNKAEDERVVGFHITCPNAGEVLQGVGVAMKAGATKKHFDDTVGIHPTVAEAMNTLTTTKSSGASAEAGGC